MQRVLRPALLPALLAGLSCVVQAQPSAGLPSSGIYTCVDAQGRQRSSDRPILECLDREQRVLNRDGSIRQLLPPSMTAEERVAAEARERQRLAERARQLEAGRRDRLLLTRYPDEEEHLKAREAALSTIRSALLNSKERMAELSRERKPLLAESEFYRGKPLPPKLQQALELNEAALEAHQSLIETQRAEFQRLNELYDRELARLRPLWAGARPGYTAAAALPAKSSP